MLDAFRSSDTKGKDILPLLTSTEQKAIDEPQNSKLKDDTVKVCHHILDASRAPNGISRSSGLSGFKKLAAPSAV